MRILLCGMPGVGKSTVGKALAQKLNCSFYDLDRVIEKREKRLCSAIYREGGEYHFQQVELEAWQSLCGSEGVIALGGGTVSNLLIQNLSGWIVYLEGERKGEYPSFIKTEEQYQELEKIRAPQFERIADLKVSVDEKGVEEVVSIIISTQRRKDAKPILSR